MLHTHRAADTTVLADALGDLLAGPLPDPFQTELVVVPAKGVERWLAQRLSHRLGSAAPRQDGVCAGVDFVRPASLVSLLTGNTDDPWEPERLAWPLLSAIDQSLDQPWAQPIARHLGEQHSGVERDVRRGRRYGLARRLAGLFASYARQRPSLLVDWREGRDGDGFGGDLPEDLAWQPQLWRLLLDLVQAQPPDQRHGAAVASLRSGEADLPPRIILFGHTRLPVTEVELLAAAAEQTEVHLFLPQVSDSQWQSLAGAEPVRRRLDDSADRVQHPLLATLGRDAREMRRQLGALVASGTDQYHAGPEPEPSTLLGWLQQDLRAGVVGADRAARVLDPGDRSIQIHACHGAARQVEVLRDAILGLLADDPTLEPRDVIVMCPDVEAWAPLIHASFGAVPEGHPAGLLRVAMADRGIAQTNPLLGIALQLVGLADGRARASELLDLFASDPVRRRFGFSDQDLERLHDWTAAAGVRWGLDRDHRSGFNLDLAQNTWAFGVDRILAGVAMAESSGLLGDALPLDDVGSSDIDLAGRLAEALHRLTAATRDLLAATTAVGWVEALRHHVAALADPGWEGEWQAAQLDRELSGIAQAATSDTRLGVADVRSLLQDRIAPRPTRSNFRTGALTVSSLVPMRAVPHRVVCLLGIDLDVFPRVLTIDGDDALMRDPVTGERDPRSEDRQLLLDAILSARDALVITYAGASEHSGKVRAPAVPVGELLDALDLTVAEPVRDRVHRAAPLQPFDASQLEPGRATTFDPAALSAAKAARNQRPPRPKLATAAPPPDADLDLGELQSFLVHPARALLRHLEIGLPWDEDQILDDLPIELDGLQRWTISNRIVSSVMGGADPDIAVLAERARGALPPGGPGQQVLDQIVRGAQAVVRAARETQTGEESELEIRIDLGAGQLTGLVRGLWDDVVVRVTPSSLGGKQAVEMWLAVLAAQVMTPDRPISGKYVGKDGRVGRIRPVEPDLARQVLTRWAGLRSRGLQRLVHLPLATGRAWARLADDPWNARRAAWRRWQDDKFASERDDPAWVWFLGRGAPLDDLTDLADLATSTWCDLLPHERGWGS